MDYAICKILYTFCKIRGEKVIVHFLSVETRWLELLITAIEGSEKAAADTEDGRVKWSWEQRYIVLLWLSHLMLAPFDLSTISSIDVEDMGLPEIPGLIIPSHLPGLTVRLLPLAVKYLAAPGKERDGAKALLVRMSMRRDMQDLGVLDSLVQWAMGALRPRRDAVPEQSYFYLGTLSYLAGVLQAASDTPYMDRYLSSVFYTVHGISNDDNAVAKCISSFAGARKMILKVMRLVIVSLLRRRKEEMDPIELTETAIGYLLDSLSDNDTPVRLAASKSLSIITLKLEPELASQVVEAVLESLNRNVLWKTTKVDGKTARDLSSVDPLEWHGLMLTLSHLVYRRSPPADQLSDIVHALLLGLTFEQRNTVGSSIGANVRDAACFGIWALARRYTTQELLAVPTQSVYAAKAHPEASSILQVLATELVVTSALDPAGNIRRGSSAALQELIGRHPDTVENGIWVVQTVDYHAVARRSRAMEEVALGVTKLSTQYGQALLDGILGWRGIGYVDASSRRHAGVGFGRILAGLSSNSVEDAFGQSEASIQLVLDRLASLEKRQVEERHGLLLCFAALIDYFPFFLTGHEDDRQTRMATALARKVISEATLILDNCKNTAYRKPELISEAGSRLVVSLMPALMVVILGENKTLYEDFANVCKTPDTCGKLASLIDGLPNKAGGDVIQPFVQSLKDIITPWLERTEQETLEPTSAAALILLILLEPADRVSTIMLWADGIRSRPKSRAVSPGDGYFYTLAIAQPLASSSDGGAKNVVCEALLQRWNTDGDIETRATILQALTRSQLLKSQPIAFLGVLSDGLNDYTTTARGDVGSHVRAQALHAVKALWLNIPDAPKSSEWVKASIDALFFGVLRLSAEKLDRVRPEAQAALSLLLRGGGWAVVSAGKPSDQVYEFTDLGISSQRYLEVLLNLHNEGERLHPALASLARHDAQAWMCELLSGLVTSADTGNEDLVISSRAALTAFCSASQDGLDLVCTALGRNLKTRQGSDRVLVPTLEVVAFLFRAGLFQKAHGVDTKNICLQTQKAGFKTGNVRKLEACVKVYGGIAATAAEGRDGGAGAAEARKRLGALLLHPWPRIRALVVDEMWGLTQDGADDKGELLMGVDWAAAQKGQIKTTTEALGFA